MSIRASELILNTDCSVYHLNLKPENIAQDIIFVGDQDRVEKVTKHFDSIEFKTQKREFMNTSRRRRRNFLAPPPPPHHRKMSWKKRELKELG